MVQWHHHHTEDGFTRIDMDNGETFASCSSCGAHWTSLANFIGDKSVELNGYQVCLPDPEDGLLLWTHYDQSCRTTFSIPVWKFKELYILDIPHESLHGTEECLQLCDRSGNLNPCAKACRLRWVRDVIQLLRERKMPASLESAVD